ncbi:methylmalonyl-CoA mutase [Saccharomonospora amisosensis]|uniref:Methylmalonyl-CoA mutase n=1 Tax=Saccharomonospora amisosensis TaxID=1128677 RepID=A0A7X5UTQ0_9PSEU|nr:methylmalonyl-CoA mutase family protein [Saccharomonospora amisosensis]NIJ14057.1 methylmalonyl-CoA mutase [Saccharomonospora amisosensis]
MTNVAELPLAAEFDRPDRADWERLVEAVLSKTGSRPEDLITRTYEGIAIQPLYTAADVAPAAGFPGLSPFVRGSRPEGHVLTGWDVRASHTHPDPAVTNRAVLADLEGGVTSSWLRVGAGALPVSSLADALHEVRLDLAPVVLDPGADYLEAADALFALLADQRVPPTSVAGGIGADPIGLLARTGRAHDVAASAELAARVAREYPAMRTVVADGLPFHEAGGSDAQELGAAVAAGVAYLRALTAAGLSVEEAAGQLEFRFAASTDQFMTIAKLRAARRLWARVGEVCGAPGTAMYQHAVTSPAMLTRRDPWVNMLRTTVACFAAGVGGADAVTVLPFDSALGLADGFGRRIARNTQAILLEESKLAAVIDPAGGSWYVENLTDALAQAAWREFTAIEAAGGIEAELGSGALAARLDLTWQARRARIATREDPITGVSEFPLLEEADLEREPATPAAEGGGLPRLRYAQDYERLRDRADARLAETGSRPSVFLATLGPLADHTARATFAANLFMAGGIEPINPGVTDDPVAAFRESGTTVACLCGSDKAYAQQAAEVAAALREAGAVSVLLAGKPADYPAVTGYVHKGCDALAVLTGTLETLGVAP